MLNFAHKLFHHPQTNKMTTREKKTHTHKLSNKMLLKSFFSLASMPEPNGFHLNNDAYLAQTTIMTLLLLCLQMLRWWDFSNCAVVVVVVVVFFGLTLVRTIVCVKLKCKCDFCSVCVCCCCKFFFVEIIILWEISNLNVRKALKILSHQLKVTEMQLRIILIVTETSQCINWHVKIPLHMKFSWNFHTKIISMEIGVNCF